MPDDLSYYRQRALTELERARSAGDPAVASVHYEMAAAYRAKLPPEPIQMQVRVA